MRLSTRGRYGVRAMLDLALNGRSGPVNLKEISARQELSPDYLEQLLRRLRKAGLVKSVRGPRGGFVLARAAEKISLWDVIVALEQDIAPVFCVDGEVVENPKRRCRRSKECATHLLWAGLARQVRAFLEGNTLQQLADSSTKLGKGPVCDSVAMFYI